MKHLEGLLANREMTIELTDSAATLLGDLGFDPAYGARPLKRAILRNIKDPLSVHLLDGRLGAGDHILVDESDGSFTFSSTPRQDWQAGAADEEDNQLSEGDYGQVIDAEFIEGDQSSV